MEPAAIPNAVMTFVSPQFILGGLVVFALIGVSIMVYRFIMTSRRESGPYDPAQVLTNSIMGMVWLLILFTGGIIVAQIVDKGSANTESWAAFTGIIGWATAKAGDIFNNRFGSTKQSADKDVTIAQQARSAAVAQDALLDPTLVVKSDKPLARATMSSAGEVASQVDVGTMNVKADVVNTATTETKGK